jgi:serine/threonine-protein kinase
MMTEEGGSFVPLALLPGGDAFSGTPYRLLRRLGQGGMGDVFLVEHRELGKEMVAKVLQRGLADDARLLDRVRLEATTLARLNHPNVVQISDFRRATDGRPFIIVEHLRGRSLKAELAERGALTLFDALDLAHQALAGLAAAHALGIAHRDVKPDNLFLSRNKEGVVTLKVIDFGLALVLPGASAGAPLPLSLPTESGSVLGTPRYLSPEAAQGKRVDHRADLYAIALILYEMVAGRGPFDGQRDLLGAQRSEPPLLLSQLTQRPVPTEFDAVIERGLRSNPEQRFQSATEFQRELELLWQLLHHSHAFATTYFSVERQPTLRTTGDLPNRALAQPATAPSEASNTAGAEPVDAADASVISRAARAGTEGRRRSSLLALSFGVGLVTLIAVAGGIVALLGRAWP